MGRKTACVVALLALSAFSFTACYSLIEKPILKRRDFQPFAAKDYLAPCQFIQVEDINLAYVEAGAGPTVILIHGGVFPIEFSDSILTTPLFDAFSLLTFHILPPRAQTYGHLGAVATIDTWQYNLEELAKHFHVLALDLPGFGNSDKPEMAYKMEDFTRYLTGFMDAKKVERASLVGLDIGGMIAMDFALTHPERVDKLVLVNTAGVDVGLTLGDPAVPGTSRIFQNNNAAQINVWIPLYQRLFLKQGVRNLLHERGQDLHQYYIVEDQGTAKEFLDQVIDYKKQYVKSEEFTKEVHALHQALVNLKRREVGEKLVQGAATIQAPTFIIWGIKNPYPPKAEGIPEYLNEAMPRSSLSTFNQSGHFPMVEEPEKFNQQVIQFLTGEVSGPAAAATP